MSCSQLRVIFSFYASTIVPAVEAVEKVSDSFISKILPYVQKVSQQSAALFFVLRFSQLQCRLSPVEGEADLLL